MKKLKTTIIGLVLAFLMAGYALSADQNIYLDNAGSGAGSEADPYGAFSEINWTTEGDNSIYDWVAADDDVYINLKKGVTWYEQFSPGTSGVSGHPITVRAYSAGVDPVIDLSATLSSWTSDTPSNSIVDFEENDLTDWDSTVTDGGNLSASAGSAMAGTSYGMQALVNDQTAIYGQLNFTQTMGKLRVRLYFDPNGFDRGGESDWINLVLFEDDTSDRLQIHYIVDSGGHHIRTSTYEESGWTHGAAIDITDAPHYIEVYWLRAISSSSNDGTCQLWIDGSLEDTVTSLDLYRDNRSKPNNMKVGLGMGDYGIDAESSGTVFIDEIQLNTDGNAIGAYGTNTVYYDGALSGDPNQAFEDGNRLDEELISGPNGLDSGQWCWDSVNTRVYVRTTGDDNPSGYTVKASEYSNGFRGEGISYITLDGITIRMPRYYGINVYPSESDWTIQNCTIENAYEVGVRISAGADNIIISDSSISFAGGSGIICSDGTDTVTISGNTIFNNCQIHGATGGAFEANAGIRMYGLDTASAIIEYNKIYLNGKNAGGTAIVTGGRGSGIHWDYSGTADTDRVTRHNEVYNNQYSGIFYEYNTDYGEIYGNVVYGNDYEGIRLYNDINETKVYSNTVYGNTREGIECHGSGAGTMNNNLFKNNISVDNTLRELKAAGGCDNGSGGSGNVYSNNCFGVEGSEFIEWGLDNYDSTYDDWETAYGGTTSSAEADPLFTDPGSDNFTLQPGSPARSGGVAISGYNDRLVPGSSWPDNVSTMTFPGSIGAYGFLGAKFIHPFFGFF